MKLVKKTMDELERFAVDVMPKTQKNPIIIILDDVRSMQNVGSVFRTADAFAVQAIFLCSITPTPPHRDIHKTALGATETVAWQYFDNVLLAIDAAKELGFVVYSVEQTHNSIPLQEIVVSALQPIALVFGNEVNGVSDTALNQSQGSIEIPQWGSKHSLNISVCVGVVSWHIVCQMKRGNER